MKIETKYDVGDIGFVESKKGEVIEIEVIGIKILSDGDDIQINYFYHTNPDQDNKSNSVFEFQLYKTRDEGLQSILDEERFTIDFFRDNNIDSRVISEILL